MEVKRALLPSCAAFESHRLTLFANNNLCVNMLFYFHRQPTHKKSLPRRPWTTFLRSVLHCVLSFRLIVCMRVSLQTSRWHIDLEPWASESRSLEDEARRFLHYITTPQVSHNRLTSHRIFLKAAFIRVFSMVHDSRNL